MDASIAEPVAIKPRRRQAVKASPRVQATKLKTTIHLSPEAAERVGLHALKAGANVSAYIEGLIMAHCRRWVISDRGGVEADIVKSAN